jgi:hypothetical protein
MKKALLFFLAIGIIASVVAQNSPKREFYKAQVRPVGVGLNLINEIPSFNGPLNTASSTDALLNKISFSSSLNVNGLFSYDERYLTLQPAANMFTFGNRAGGAYGNTGNDLKYSFTTDQGASWDSAVVPALAGHNFRYPSMVTWNPTGSTDPNAMYGIFSGPITDGAVWIEQYWGSIKLDGTNKDVTYQANFPTTYLDHLNICLYCSPDGHATVASSYLMGDATLSWQNGFHILNGTWNSGTNKFDWSPRDSLKPNVLESGRTDAPAIAWSVDGSIGYFVCTAIDADPAYNPYGVEWPVIYKSTDHGVTWVKEPPFDFSTIGNLKGMLWPTLADPNVTIPRWFNKWADERNEDVNGMVVDKNGNLHIFGYVAPTLSIHPDSLSYMYANNPRQMFDVFMTPYGGWNAIYIDTLKSFNVPTTGAYAMAWYHQMQMSRNADGSKLFMLWTDTDPFFGTENTSPDIKGVGLDADTWNLSPVKNFTEATAYWGENFWMRLAYDVFYDAGTGVYSMPVTTSIPGATGSDPLVHQFVTGLEFTDADFTIPVGVPASQSASALVSGNYPNPFRGTTSVTVNLQNASSVSLSVSSIVGQQISTENYGTMSAGVHTLNINGANLTSGVYLYTVKINGDSYTKKMIVK